MPRIPGDPLPTPPVHAERRRPRRSQTPLLLSAVLFLGASGLFVAVEAIDAHQLGDQARLHGSAHSLAAVVDTQLDAFVGAMQMLAASGRLDDLTAFEAEARTAGAALGGWFLLLGPGPAHPMLLNTRSPPGTPLPQSVEAWHSPTIAPALQRVLAEGRPQLTDLFADPVSGIPMLALLTSVDRPGQPRHVLALGFDPAVLQTLLGSNPVPVGGFAAIVDSGRGILAAALGASSGTVVQPDALVLQTLAGDGPGLDPSEHALVVERPTRAPGWSVILGAPRAHQHASLSNMLPWLVAGGTLFGFGVLLVVLVVRREALDTARSEAAALREGRAEIERLHAGLPVILFVTEVGGDGRGQRRYLGGDVRAVSGWDRAEFDALVAHRLADPATAARLRGYFAAVLRHGSATAEFPLPRPDGSTGAMDITTRVLERTADGAMVVGCILDATSRREAERRATAAARLASLGETAACLAHEVKQPLLTMSLAAELAEMALQRQDATEAQRLLGGIVERAQRTAEMIDRLRRFARGADDTAATDDVPLDIPVGGCLALVGAALAEAGVTVEQSLGMPVPMVRGQAILIEQVLANLLLNARDAMAARSEALPRLVRITATRQAQGFVALEVADTGGGIAPAMMDKLFEPFASSKGSEKGTGLGLSISRGLVRAMGGSISARNSGTGAVFTIVLRDGEASAAAMPQTLAA